MEELKGGVANMEVAKDDQDYASYSITKVTVSVSMWTLSWS
jgi:hypothetical protein